MTMSSTRGGAKSPMDEKLRSLPGYLSIHHLRDMIDVFFSSAFHMALRLSQVRMSLPILIPRHDGVEYTMTRRHNSNEK